VAPRNITHNRGPLLRAPVVVQAARLHGQEQAGRLHHENNRPANPKPARTDRRRSARLTGPDGRSTVRMIARRAPPRPEFRR